MMCLFQLFIKSPSVHQGGVSDPVPCIVGPSPTPLCEETTAIAPSAANIVPPHPGFSRPSSPYTIAGAATGGLARFHGGFDPTATSITSSPLGNY